MPTVTTTLEDTSPLITFSANWQAGTSGDDNLVDSYSQSSYMLTQKQGATVSFSFYGTSVTVYGARRSNHGNYTGQLDDNPALQSNGELTLPLFNQVLSNSNATLGHHNLTITNNDNAFFDVDYITFESSVGQDDENLIVNTFKDTHPAFIYNPVSSWETPANVGLFMGGSGHATTDSSSVATFTFQVTRWHGPVGPNSSTLYSVQVDNQNPSFFSANEVFYRPQKVLYFVGNLGSGQHSLKIQGGGPAVQDEFAVDYATVYTTRSLGGSFVVTDSSKTISLSNLGYKRKPKVRAQGPEFARPFLVYPALKRAENGQSDECAGADSQVMGAQSEIHPFTSIPHLDAPVSASEHGHAGPREQVQGTSRPTWLEKSRTNPADSGR